MSEPTFVAMLAEIVKQQIDSRNLTPLVEQTGISKHWFYEISKGNIKDPRCTTVIKFLKAINHPINANIEDSVRDYFKNKNREQ